MTSGHCLTEVSSRHIHNRHALSLSFWSWRRGGSCSPSFDHGESASALSRHRSRRRTCPLSGA